MRETPLRVEDGVLRLHVWVVPGASRTQLAGVHGDKMKIRVASPPEAGRANRDLVDVLEGALGGTVRLVGGMHSRHKVFEIPGQDVATATRKLGLGG